jgi:prepilin-type N-terminal cleavage/methylation domain-containing protein
MTHEHRSSRPGRDAGFTLLETLVALALLGLLTTFLIAGLRLGSRYLQAAISRAEPADAIATAQDVLRRMLEETYPALVYGDAGQQPVFDGRADHLTFATTVPPSLGLDGYDRIDLYADGGRLLLRWQPERSQAQAFTGDDTKGPYPLLDHVAAVHFQYFGAASPQDKPAWTDQWHSLVRSPLLVRVDVTSDSVPARVWPPLIVAPQTDVDVTCVYDPLSHSCQGR